MGHHADRCHDIQTVYGNSVYTNAHIKMTEPLLDITWDDVKAQSNLGKHGVTFAQAATVMLDPLALTVLDEAYSKTEERWFTLGRTSEGRFLAVAHMYQMLDANTARIRLISAREATRRESQQYENEPR